MEKRRPRKKVNIPMCAACILLCLTLFSVHLSSGIMARYTTTSGGSDSARVIRFGSVTMTKYGGSNQYIAPGVELTWNADVSFSGSEAATFIFLEVTPAGNCTVSDDGRTFTISTTGGERKSVAAWTVAEGWTPLPAEGNTYIYSLALAPNAVLNKKTFFTSNTAVISDNLTADDVASVGTISASFRASVVQSNGFASPAAAWQSLQTHHS